MVIRTPVRVIAASLSLLAIGSLPARAKPRAVEPAAESLRVGDMTVVALRDADNVLDNDGKVFGIGVGPAAVAAVLKDAGAPSDTITLGVDALLVKAAGRVMLFDTGLGPGVHGALMGSLARAGVAPAEVTDVFITHTHGDHVGGLVTAEGAQAFPKAVVHLSAAEWAWMQAQPNAQGIVKVIAPQVRPFEAGAAVVPGVTALALPGHTPGHAGYVIGSGAATITDIGDTAHSAVVSLAEPDWAIGYDTDNTEGEATRRAELKRLADSRTLIFAPHFPFPGIGRIVAKGNGFAWQPGVP